VAAWAVTPVHHHHVSVAGSDQRVGERHARGARSDDQIIGLDLAHSPISPPPPLYARSFKAVRSCVYAVNDGLPDPRDASAAAPFARH
jgi:hypothetical protein